MVWMGGTGQRVSKRTARTAPFAAPTVDKPPPQLGVASVEVPRSTCDEGLGGGHPVLHVVPLAGDVTVGDGIRCSPACQQHRYHHPGTHTGGTWARHGVSSTSLVHHIHYSCNCMQ
jgi:hypothetical protein